MTSEKSILDNKTDFVQSLARGLEVINAFSKDSPSMTLTEVAESVGLNRATARRFLLTLQSLGYISSTGKQFALTPKVMELGFSYLSGLGLTDLISPHLVSLSNELHESASAAILDGTDIVYIARAAGQKIMQVQITIGTRFPAAFTSMGRVILADLSTDKQREILSRTHLTPLTQHTKVSSEEILSELQKVKSQGFAFVDQELELGLRSLAVPIRNKQGLIVAAINVSAAASGSSESAVNSLLPQLTQCALAIEKSIQR